MSKNKNLIKSKVNKTILYSLFFNLLIGLMLVNSSNELIAQKSNQNSNQKSNTKNNSNNTKSKTQNSSTNNMNSNSSPNANQSENANSTEKVTKKTSNTVDMTKRPESLESKDFTFPKFTEKTLSNGLKVFFVEDKEQPTLNLNFVFKGGKLAEKKADVADFMATLLNKGTKKRSALDIAESLDGIGADISASASNDYVNLSVFTLTKHQDNVLEILTDIILNAKFSDEELEKLAPKAIAGLKGKYWFFS